MILDVKERYARIIYEIWTEIDRVGFNDLRRKSISIDMKRAIRQEYGSAFDRLKASIINTVEKESEMSRNLSTAIIGCIALLSLLAIIVPIIVMDRTLFKLELEISERLAQQTDLTPVQITCVVRRANCTVVDISPNE